ncbi:MAG: sortase domain-containing protein [Ilumatobacteraceae bacterium]
MAEPRPSEPTSHEQFDRRRFLIGAGSMVGLGITAAAFVAEGVSAAPAGAGAFVPLPAQRRIADTRNPQTYPFERLTDRRIRVAIRGVPGVPANATAAVLTVTLVNRSGFNFVSVYPAGSAVPEASNLNAALHDEVAANLVTVQLGASGAVDLDAFDVCDLVVDIAGVYVPASGGVARSGRFVALPSAHRVIDTRSTAIVQPGEAVVVDVASVVPADASSVVVNLTTTGTLAWGFFTCYPLDADSPPETSNLNVNGPGQTRAAAAVVKVTAAGNVRGFKVWSFGGGHVIVDVAGYYTGDGSPLSSTGLFVPMAPQRILDTRKPGAIGRLWSGWTVETAIPDPARTGAQAIVANVTAVDARGAGWFTVLAARTPMQVVSNLNVVAEHDTVPNHVISRISTAGLAVYSQTGAHVLVDMAGYFTGSPAATTEAPPVNPPPPSIGPPWLLNVPRLGLSSWVYGAQNPNSIVNAGHSWHWTGTGSMGEFAHVSLFAHRTTHGGIYRYIHLLEPGDEMFIDTVDNRRYRYRVTRRDLSSPVTSEILFTTRQFEGTSLSLIACTLPNFQPTSTAWRIIVTGELVDWTEL